MNARFRALFLAHLAVVVLVSIGAYRGILPTSLPAIPYGDKVGHAILIGGLGYSLDGALGRRRLFALPSLAAVIILLFAGIEEYAQRLSPRRTSDVWDFAADAVGVFASVWLSRRWSRVAAPARQR